MYNENVAKEIQDIVDRFFKLEQGNRVTEFNIKGLVVELNIALGKNKIVEKEEE